jgi:ATP-binding cassette subfamily C protein EexD
VEELLEVLPPDEKPMPLPAPKGELAVERVTVVPPGGTKPILKNVSMLVPAGGTVAIIGPSGAGKSTLVRAILGIMPASQGAVRMDGAELGQWDRDVLGGYIGYLPQDVELLDGSIGENIARFGDVNPDKVVQAAKAAGVHEMILRLSDGYDTVVTGQVLSAGQRQRVGLARALYGNPSILLLDEPNSNLDQDGDLALARALQALKQAKRTVLLITHRNNLLGIADRILLLVDGEVAMFDERDKVLASLQQAATRAASSTPGTSGTSGPVAAPAGNAVATITAKGSATASSGAVAQGHPGIDTQ